MAYWRPFINFFLFFLFVGNGMSLAGDSKVQENSSTLVDRIVATVNGEPVLLSELEEMEKKLASEWKREGQKELSPMDLRRKALDFQMNELLISKEIERRGLSATDSFVETALQTVMQQNGFTNQQQLSQALKTEGLTLSEYRKSLKKQIERSRLINEVIRPRVQVTHQDVETALREKSLGQPSQLRVSLRMIYKTKPKTTRKKMEDFRRQIEVGIPFERIAQKETEGPAQSEGGLIGFVSPTDLQSELRPYVQKLKKGEISEIIETPQGFYLLQCLETKQEISASALPNQEKLKEELIDRETSKNLDDFVQGLRTKSHIEILL